VETLEEGILGNLSFEDLESAYEDGDREEIKPRQPDNTNKELTEIKQESIGSKSTGIERKNNTFLQYEEYYDRIKEEHILERVIDQYKTYEDKEAALSAIRPLIAIIKGNEYVLISVLADLKRRNVYRELGFKSHNEAMAALFSLEGKTCSTYTDVGLTYFTIDGKPVANYVAVLTIGHLIQLKGMIKGACYVYGNKVGHEFIDAIIKASPRIPTVNNWNEILKALRNGDIPDALVDSDNNGNWVIAGSDIVLHGYKKSEEVIVKPSLFDVNAIGAASVYPLSDLTKVLEVIGRHDMSEEQAEDFKAAVEKLMQVVNDIYGK